MSAPGAEPLEIPLLRPPRRDLFRRRAERLRSLAPGHAAEDFLAFLAQLVTAQAEVLEGLRLAEESFALSDRGLPVSWRQALAEVLGKVEGANVPAGVRATTARLRALGSSDLEALASRVVSGDTEKAEAALVPFVGAALQVVFTASAARPPPEVAARPDGLCPVCGAPPVAGVVLGDDRLRYLACSLCGSQWHSTRLVCTTCGEVGGLTYYALEPRYVAVKAEACSACRTYLKLFYLERDSRVEPLADDAATPALDLLVAAEGYARGGVNCLWA